MQQKTNDLTDFVEQVLLKYTGGNRKVINTLEQKEIMWQFVPILRALQMSQTTLKKICISEQKISHAKSNSCICRWIFSSWAKHYKNAEL